MPVFLNPLSFWFLALIVPLVALYILKIRRQNRVVPSTLLWQSIVNDLEANTPFQKLRRNIILILQIIFIVLVTLSMAQPVIRTASDEPYHSVIIIDASASMQAVEESGIRRFDAALRTAGEIIGNMAEGDYTCVIEAGPVVRIVHSFSSDKAALMKSFGSMHPYCQSSNLRESFYIANTLLEKKTRKAIYILTDGNDASINSLPATDVVVKYVCIGITSDNIAVTNASAVPAGDDAWIEANKEKLLSNAVVQQPYDIFLQVENFSGDAKSFYITFRSIKSNDIIDSKQASLDAGEHKGFIFNTALAPGIYKLTVEEEDALSLDNTAYFDFENSPFTRVLICGGDDVLVKKVIEAKKDCLVYYTADLKGIDVSRYDLVIFQNSTPPDGFAANHMVINPQDNKRYGLTDEEFQVSNITEIDREHPILRFMDFADVHILRTRMVKQPGWKGLVSVDGNKLIALMDEPVVTLLVPFDIYDSDWPLRSSFPMFFHNVAGYVKSKSSLKKTVSAVSPSGIRHEGVEIAFDEPGVYTVTYEGGLEKKRVNNFFNADESCIAPAVGTINIGAKPVAKSTSGVEKTNREIWQFVVLLALGLACLEWYFYHRRNIL